MLVSRRVTYSLKRCPKTSHHQNHYIFTVESITVTLGGGVDPTNIKWNLIFSGSCCTTVDGINPANQYPVMHMVLYIPGGDPQMSKSSTHRRVASIWRQPNQRKIVHPKIPSKCSLKRLHQGWFSTPRWVALNDPCCFFQRKPPEDVATCNAKRPKILIDLTSFRGLAGNWSWYTLSKTNSHSPWRWFRRRSISSKTYNIHVHQQKMKKPFSAGGMIPSKVSDVYLKVWGTV